MPDLPLKLTDIEAREAKDFCTSRIGRLNERKQNIERAIAAAENEITWLKIDIQNTDREIQEISEFRSKIRGE